MPTTVLEQIWGELIRDGKTLYTIKLDLTVKELFVHERSTPVGRGISRMTLSPMSVVAVADGRYTLRYTFNGKQHEDSGRVRDDMLFAASTRRRTAIAALSR